MHSATRLDVELASSPPPRLLTAASQNVALWRSKVGQCDPKAWSTAVSARDPVTFLKRRMKHINRATFKMHELVGRMDLRAPKMAILLAEAPGGFLFSVKEHWPACSCVAMSHEADDAIRFDPRAANFTISGLPNEGDLLHSQVESELLKRYRATADLVTADGGVHVEDLDFAEQHSFRLVLAQTAAALQLQKEGGSFVLKVFEACTLPTREVFEILRKLYSNTMLCKPACSRACNSERYFIACGLLDEQRAADAARQLRDAVNRSHGLFVTTLGVRVSDLAHRAMDTLAEEQAGSIRGVLAAASCGDLSGLRKLAAQEAADVKFTLPGDPSSTSPNLGPDCHKKRPRHKENGPA